MNKSIIYIGRKEGEMKINLLNFPQVDLKHMNQSEDSPDIELGIDLQDYYISVEWDIMEVPAKRNEKYYSCCEGTYFLRNSI